MKFFLFKLIIFASLAFQTVSSQELPPIRLDYATQILCHDGRILGYIGNKSRVDLRSTGYVSKYVIYSLIATEDRDFYNHHGVSYKGLARGILKTLTGSTQGGSTLTMQLVKNLFLSSERTISRKLTEIDLAQKLEDKYSKDQILLLYLNTVYFGRGVYGIWAAAQEYFGKTPDKLTVTESATLIGLLKNPNGYEPEKHADKLLSRRNEVLYNLVEVGKIKESEFKKYKSSPLNLKLHHDVGKFFIEQVRKEAYNIVHPMGKALNTDELKIYTTCDYAVQKAADDAVDAQWNNFSGNMKNAQCGLITVENGTPFIRAMVGGNPTTDAKGLNRAMQIKRQPGSAFKPFLYSYLLQQGYSLATPLHDSTIVVDSGMAYEWRPMNSEEESTGKYIPMITAVQHSVNLCAADAVTRLTSPDSVIQFAHQLGIQSPLPSYPSIALGTGEVSPLEMASAYSVFPSMGMHCKPVTILKIEDKHGSVYYQYTPQKDTVLDSATCYLTTFALKSVVDSGTAASIRRMYRGFAAGKTGTTSDYTDAWFVGFNRQFTTAIWVGFDNPKYKLYGGYQYGGTASAPIWGRMMGALAMKNSSIGKENMLLPTNIAMLELCKESGDLAGPLCTNKWFLPVNLSKPPVTCRMHPATLVPDSSLTKP